MGDSNIESASVGSDLIRSIFAFFDRPAYWLLGLVYELFFSVASTEFLSSTTMLRFYGRVQVLLGVFMMFELAIVFLRAIAQPDSFSKEKGFGTLLTRVVTSLLIITSLMPISIASPRNSYERKISESGLLFGTLYSLQDRLLTNNTIGRLIMGSAAPDHDFVNTTQSQNQKLKDAANRFTTTVLKGFYRINLVPESERTSTSGSIDPASIKSNRVCQDSNSDKIISYYNSNSITPGEIISLVNETCDINSGLLTTLGNGLNSILKIHTGNQKYIFNYMPVISTIVAIVFVFIFLGFTVDVAVRAIKLSILRLLAPIPVLSHIDPRGKDSAFNAWVKTLTSTYLDLFIRLAVVYFVIFIISEMIANGLNVGGGATGAVKVFTVIVIWIGLLVFAKQAPKFIKDMIGIKGDSFKLFGGIGEALAIGAVGAGVLSSAHSARVSSREADIANHKNPDSFWNKGKHVAAGLFGGIAGGVTGAKAYSGAKDHAGRAVLDAVQKKNATRYAQGNSGSTFLGRAGASLSRTFLGETPASSGERAIANDKSRKESMEAIKSRVSGEMVKQDWTYGTGGKGFTGTDSTGATINLDNMKFNYKNFMSQLEAAKAAGRDHITVRASNGVDYTIEYSAADRMKGAILKNNEDDYIKKARLDNFTAEDGTVYSGTNNKQDVELVSLIQDAMEKGGSGWDAATGTYSHDRHGDITSRDDYTKTAEKLGADIRDAQRKNAKAKADDQFSSKK